MLCVCVQIFDKFLPRLQDSNSKVNLHALKVMHQVVPMLKETLHSVLSMAVASIVPNLSSKNSEIKLTAADILNSFMENLGVCESHFVRFDVRAGFFLLLLSLCARCVCRWSCAWV